MHNKQQALQIIKDLIKKFKLNEADYEKDTYLEMSVRSNFIDLFFEAFNWDVYGNKALPVNESEVLRENHVSEFNSKRVDYAFRVGGAVRFIVEAKKPSENLNKLNHIFQVKSYAFSMGVNLAILTNFKTFKVFDLKSKPLYNQPQVDCVEEFCIEYEEYANLFDKIWRLFEYNNVISGSLEKFYFDNRKGMTQGQIDEALRSYNKRGTTLLNKAFLADLLLWRGELAKSIYNKNDNISMYTLNEMVQRYIDRIIFMRIIEDRRIEGKDVLASICNEWVKSKSYSLHEKLEECFKELNYKYNGMLFKKYEGFQTLSIEEDVLYDFIMSLYVPCSPYNFAIISIDILGKIFEQYLGYTIVLNSGMISLVCKEGKKKNTGAYYTRQEIVEKIVQESVVTKIQSLTTLNDLKNYKLLDMACGSGTFLIEAYRVIVHRYEQIITQMLLNGENIPKEYYFMEKDIVHLTMSYKKEVVINNIFGVDIDPQAIEVAKMSMYILMLELNYKDDSVRPILPALDENIKVGNSIISDDYYEFYKIDMDMDRIINPFNYEKEFATVFEAGGFDCIIGNPPYISIQTLNKMYPEQMINYINMHYVQTAKGNYDTYVIFLEKALKLLKTDGKLGMIILNNFFKSDYGEGLRELLASNKYVKRIVDFGDVQVFDNSKVYTCLLFLEKWRHKEFLYSKVTDYNEWREKEACHKLLLSCDALSKEPWTFSDTMYKELERNVFESCQTIKDIAKVFAGVQPLKNNIYLLTVVKSDDKFEYCVQDDNTDGIEYKFEKAALKKLTKGSRDIKRYQHSLNRRLIFPYSLIEGKAEVIDEDTYKARYPETYTYLLKYKNELQKKHKVCSNKKPWYRYAYVKNHARFEQPKILIPAMVYGSRFSYDEEGDIYMTCGGPSAGGGNVLVLSDNCDHYTYSSLLAIMNSALFSYLIVREGIPKRGGWQGIGKDFIDSLPIPIIGDDKEKKDLVKSLGKAADMLINVYKFQTLSESDEIRKKRRIEKLLRDVDLAVFKLYRIEERMCELILKELGDKGYY